MALEHARKATEAHDEYFPAVGLYAGLLLRAGKMDKALQQFDRMKFLSPESAKVSKDSIMNYLIDTLHLSDADAKQIGDLLEAEGFDSEAPEEHALNAVHLDKAG